MCQPHRGSPRRYRSTPRSRPSDCTYLVFRQCMSLRLKEKELNGLSLASSSRISSEVPRYPAESSLQLHVPRFPPKSVFAIQTSFRYIHHIVAITSLQLRRCNHVVAITSSQPRRCNHVVAITALKHPEPSPTKTTPTMSMSSIPFPKRDSLN